jgi:hypothetical protein
MITLTADQEGRDAGDPLVLDVAVPKGTDPAILPSLRHGIEQAVSLLLTTGQTQMLAQADHLAELVSGLTEPDLGLIEERIQRLKTIQEMLDEGEWLTAEMLNRLQPEPPSNKSHPASDWKRRDRIFGVSLSGKEYFARYQFDALYQPLPIIKEILKAFGPVADSWKIAAWFHFPNGWIVEPGSNGNSPRPVAPKDALDRRNDVLDALREGRGSYSA